MKKHFSFFHFHSIKKRNLRNFLVFFSLMVAITLLLTLMMFSQASGILLENTYLTSLAAMEQSQEHIRVLLDTATKFTTEIHADATFYPLLYSGGPAYYEVMPALNRLNAMLALIPYVESIYIVNDSTQTVYLSTSSNNDSLTNQVLSYEEFPDKDALHFLDSYSFSTPTPVLRTYTMENTQEEKSSFTIVLCDWQERAGKLQRAIMINLSCDYFTDIMQSLHNRQESSQIITISQDGKVLSQIGDTSTDLAQEIMETSIWDRAETAPSGFFQKELLGENKLVIYAADTSMGWMCIQCIPYYRLLSPIVDLCYSALLICLGMLIVASSLALWLTWRISKPLDDAESHLLILNQKLSDAEQNASRDVLFHFMQGRPTQKILDRFYSLPEDKRPCVAHGWYCVSVLFFDDFEPLRQMSEKQLLDFISQTAHVVEESMPKDILCSSVLSPSKTITFLLSSENLDTESLVPEALHNAQVKLNSQGISVSTMTSTYSHTLSHIYGIYQQARSFSRQQVFYGRQSSIMMSAVSRTAEPAYLYPSAKEKAMLSEITRGNGEEAYKMYLEIIEDSRQYSFSAFYAALAHIVLALTDLQKKVTSDSAETRPLDFDALTRLEQYHSTEELNQQLHHCIQQLAESVVQNKSSSKSRLIQAIDKILEEQYSDSSLGIDGIAAQLKMSANYIGRTYKQYTTVTILDHLLEIRMSQARHLLSTTNMTVSAVASAVGFSNDTYFYKLFKEKHHMTPAEFRARGGD